MNKLKRYLGLAAALLLLLTVVPFPNRHSPTPFISIATVMMTFVHPAGRFWISGASDFLGEAKTCRAEVRREDCQRSFHSVERFVTRHQPELDMLGLFERYSSARRARANLDDEQRRLLGMSMNRAYRAPALTAQAATEFPGQTPPPSQEEVQRYRDARKAQYARIEKLELESARLEELESQVAAALEKYAAERRPGLAGAIYAVHALLLLLGVLMVRKRHGVGEAILWPFAALIGAAKGSAQAAKRFHDKV